MVVAKCQKLGSHWWLIVVWIHFWNLNDKENWFSEQNYINLDAIYNLLPFRKFEWDGNANWNQEMLLDEA